MKTLKILLCLLAFTTIVQAQQTTLKWSANGMYRMEVFDWQYGRYGRGSTSPYKLALETQDGYLYGTQALTELRKPVWGENGDQTFEDILPVLTPAVPQFIWDPTATFPWYPFDKNDTSTWPTSDPDNGRGWECEAPSGIPGAHQYFQNMPYTTANIWGMLNIFQYRKQKVMIDEPLPVPNPMYPIIEAQRNAERAEYLHILQTTFTLMGNYSFPSFRSAPATNLRWYLKQEGEETFAEIPVDPNYWLASPTGGWIKLMRPVKPDEISTGTYPVNVMESQFNAKVASTILLTGETRVKRLLGL